MYPHHQHRVFKLSSSLSSIVQHIIIVSVSFDHQHLIFEPSSSLSVAQFFIITAVGRASHRRHLISSSSSARARALLWDKRADACGEDPSVHVSGMEGTIQCEKEGRTGKGKERAGERAEGRGGGGHRDERKGARARAGLSAQAGPPGAGWRSPCPHPHPSSSTPHLRVTEVRTGQTSGRSGGGRVGALGTPAPSANPAAGRLGVRPMPGGAGPATRRQPARRTRRVLSPRPGAAAQPPGRGGGGGGPSGPSARGAAGPISGGGRWRAGGACGVGVGGG